MGHYKKYFTNFHSKRPTFYGEVYKDKGGELVVVCKDLNISEYVMGCTIKGKVPACYPGNLGSSRGLIFMY